MSYVINGEAALVNDDNAHQFLDAARGGAPITQEAITVALIHTGDITATSARERDLATQAKQQEAQTWPIWD